MEIKDRIKKITVNLHKYRYALLVVVIGLVMMAVPITKSEEQHTVETVPESQSVKLDLETSLSQILSKIQGAGDVYVMLTTTHGEEILYQTDQDSATGAESASMQTNTVTVTDAQRNETGLIRQTNPPKYLGAIIVCTGADDPAVRLSIVDAVSKVTGIGANRISVLKTK